MAHEEDKKDITLDDLLRIVDTAAQTIERLQAANASLMQQMRQCKSVAAAAAQDAGRTAQQIAELEMSEEALREDAKWCRWFKNKYCGSTFFSFIEREYQKDNAAQDQPAADHSFSPALSPPSGVARNPA